MKTLTFNIKMMMFSTELFYVVLEHREREKDNFWWWSSGKEKYWRTHGEYIYTGYHEGYFRIYKFYKSKQAHLYIRKYCKVNNCKYKIKLHETN
jgi:hypothetical protein